MVRSKKEVEKNIKLGRTHEEERFYFGWVDFDHNNETAVHNDIQDFLYQSSSYGFSTWLQSSETMNSNIPLAKKWRNRNEFERKPTSSELSNSQSNIMNKLTQSVDKFSYLELMRLFSYEQITFLHFLYLICQMNILVVYFRCKKNCISLKQL